VTSFRLAYIRHRLLSDDLDEAERDELIEERDLLVDKEWEYLKDEYMETTHDDEPED